MNLPRATFNYRPAEDEYKVIRESVKALERLQVSDKPTGADLNHALNYLRSALARYEYGNGHNRS